jgi:hypothetical protein
MSVHASQLFHTIVVVGTAMGCGTTPDEASLPEAGSSPLPEGGDSGRTGPAACASPAQYQCDSGSPDACTCNLEAPQGVCDCARPGEFRCHDCLSGPAVLGRCPLNDGVGCFCNTSIDIAAPTDCTHPEQFACSPPSAVSLPDDDAGLLLSAPDWFDYAECSCDTTRPTATTDCSCARCSFSCSTDACPPGSAGAALSGVRFDCACVSTPVPIAP